MKGYGNQTRAERFRMLDAPALSPLPLMTYEYTEYKAVKVGPDYHVEYARHWYPVPHELVGQRLSLKAGQTVVQIWHKGQCVAQHPRSSHEYKHTTNPLHMPAQDTGAADRDGMQHRPVHRQGGRVHAESKGSSGAGLPRGTRSDRAAEKIRKRATGKSQLRRLAL